jgi:hypothetical protein
MWWRFRFAEALFRCHEHEHEHQHENEHEHEHEHDVSVSTAHHGRGIGLDLQWMILREERPRSSAASVAQSSHQHAIVRRKPRFV